MNSLNIISARVSPTSSPAPSRSNSLSQIGLAVSPPDEPLVSSSDDPNNTDTGVTTTEESNDHVFMKPHDHDIKQATIPDETSPLLEKSAPEMGVRSRPWHVLPRRIASGLIDSIRWVLSTIAAPGVYFIACLYDANGNFAPLNQLKTLFGMYGGNPRKLAADYHESAVLDEKEKSSRRGSQALKHKHTFTVSRPAVLSGSSSSGVSSESESDVGSKPQSTRRSSMSSSRHARSKSLQPSDEGAQSSRSIKIKLHQDSHTKKHRKTQSTNTNDALAGNDESDELSAQLKSPTSPISALTKYPKTPAPPRPLIPRRQPSYIPNEEPQDPKQLKTLILDLDETLIHSMSKGGRMGSGHMVEVRLNTAGTAGGNMLGPQHPILYYVHKRPHCDEFLRKVCKWFNLVIFTASVQEYADPVIDWLESERKFFTGRYYRQHCTFRHGAFIKDLSSIEPDLSKVMILDNSPLSYMFHQDNAIPIQGWINDPTDNDLLHLVPLLEGLQYVSDVRALLALRGGEDGQHVT
ncbi:NLI interacting factor-like phosphatase-domain-containing protein [Xylariaceae sp. FL0255]|nr:NLI interacting factor-like phosphatase-domain-containing protein [Xylariaceae sp. FL0255]